MLKCIMVNCFYATEIMDLSQFLLVFICNCVILSNRIVVLNTILIEDNSTGVSDNLSAVHLPVIYILTLLFHHHVFCVCYCRYHAIGSLWISLTVVFFNTVVFCHCVRLFLEWSLILSITVGLLSNTNVSDTY